MNHELDPRLQQVLRDLPVPPPSPGFAARVLGAGRARSRPAWRPAFALAASLLVSIGAGFLWMQHPVPADQGAGPIALVSANQVEPVRLVFRSPRALQGVTLHLQLPEGVELAGYSGQRELRWQVDLQAGANSLELPVLVRQGNGGLMTASLTHGPDRRQFAVQVKTRLPAARNFDSPRGLTSLGNPWPQQSL